MKTLTEEQLARLLTNKEVLISVSEPWDFEYPGGATSLRGRISQILPETDDPSNQQVHVELEIPFSSEEGPEITHLVARLRHVLPESMIELLASGEHVSANLSYSEQVPESARIPGTTPKLIGRLGLSNGE